MAEKSNYTSAKRVLRLIRAMNTPKGQTWEQITSQVGGYSPDLEASQRMFLRDLLLLEELDFQVERDLIAQGTSSRHLYRLVMPERFFQGKNRKETVY